MPEPTSLQSKVPAKLAGQRLLDYLTIRFGYKTREEWGLLVRHGKVTVAGKAAGADRKLAQGDLVAYEVVLHEPPVNREIAILHDEATFVVVAKPGQLPSHADGNFVTHTLIHILTERMRTGGWTGLVRLVHRLDRETSGVMVVAKDRAAHRNLMAQFAAGTVEKEYLAVVAGTVAEERFEVRGLLGRDPTSRISTRHALLAPAAEGGRESLTLFERVRGLNGATLVRCTPKTGRTNQIRVHLHAAGHPVIGDKLYGKTDEEFLAFIRHVKAGGDPGYAGHAAAPRQLLHAARLSFAHPVTGAKLAFAAPVPADLQAWMEAHQGFP